MLPKNSQSGCEPDVHRGKSGCQETKGAIMAKRKRTVGLIAFLKGNTDPAVCMPGCANYDHHYGGCLFGDACLVEQGKRCGYFEKAVLPTAKDAGLREHVYSLYQKHTGIEACGELDREPAPRCPDCGAELRPRQRYCDACATRRRRQSYRRARQKRTADAQQLRKSGPRILQSKACLEVV